MQELPKQHIPVDYVCSTSRGEKKKGLMLWRTWVRLSVLASAAAIFEATFRVLVDIRRPESSSIAVEIWRFQSDQRETLDIEIRLRIESPGFNRFGIGESGIVDVSELVWMRG